MLRRTLVASGLSPLLAKSLGRSGVHGSTVKCGQGPINDPTMIHAGIADIAKEIHSKFGESNHLFVRSSVGSGKTTFAMLLRQASPSSVWYIPTWDIGVSFQQNLRRAENGKNQVLGDGHRQYTQRQVADILEAIKDDLLIIDDCRRLVGSLHDNNLYCTFESARHTPHMLLLSTSGEADKGTKTLWEDDPKLINNKAFIDFALSEEDIAKLLELSFTATSLEAGSTSYARLARILFRYHQGHKLLTMQAIEALCTTHQDKAVTEAAVMRACVSRPVTTCRAASFQSDVNKDPNWLRSAALLLSNGCIKSSWLRDDDDDDIDRGGHLESLLVQGAIVPVEQHPSAQAMLTTPETTESVYVSSNPLTARAMVKLLKARAPHTLPVVGEINGAEDVVLAGLAHLDFTVDDTIQPCAMVTHQMAFAKAFKRLGYRFDHSRGRIADKRTNKTYFVEVLECGDLLDPPTDMHTNKNQITKEQSLKNKVEIHVERFYEQPEYQEALNSSDGVAVVVFTSRNSVEDAKKEVRKSFRSAEKAIKNAEEQKQFCAKVTGVVLEELSCWEYNVFVIKWVRNEWREFALGRVLSDCVARRFVAKFAKQDSPHIAVNHSCPTDLEVCHLLNRPMALTSSTQSTLFDKRQWSIRKPQKLIPKLSVWVRGEGATSTAFEAYPCNNTIASLKAAVKPNWDPTEQAAIKIFEWDATRNAPKKDAVTKPSTPLQANTDETAYTFAM